jgi:hypothetical protein
MESSSTQPLLGGPPHPPPPRSLRDLHNQYRQRARAFLSSRTQHYTVLLLVTLDLLGIFADIIINLYQCDSPSASPSWTDVRNGLGIADLVFSCMFMVELLLSVWAFGWGYFLSYFHSFDAAVIVAGFVTDVVLHGVLEEVASLVVVLRLWRFFKIIEEIGVAAEEQMAVLEGKIAQLETENEGLKREAKKRGGRDEDAAL